MAGKKARRERRLQQRQEQLAQRSCRPRLSAEERAKRRRERFGALRRSPAPSVSNMIWHVGEPLIDEYAKTPEDIERMIGLVVAAWNLTLLPEEEREEFRAKLVYELFGRKAFGGVPLAPSQEQVATFRWVCNVVAERKEQLYPRVNRWITDFRVAVAGSEVQINVISTTCMTDAAPHSS